MSDRYKRGYASSGGRSRRSRSRSRSYSPDRYRKRSPDDYSRSRRSPDSYSRKRSPDTYRKRDSPTRYKDRRSKDSSDEDLPKAPPAPTITAKPVAISMSKFKAPPKTGIQLKLGGTSKKETPKPVKVASVFNNDSDEEPEEMPAECKMRMKNIGRDTPTSSGPNSFGKTKQGFCDSKKMFEKKLKEMAAD
ncbi:PEST proteolytic signal-containing nuclear protein-like [Culicoides brevitarsis]|uniref:PEST proteolytic signal-containing nuclear protein-like n=1 Tax=Culicoides brevitarsis TaxID=469753 RepID=UPI00307C7045